MAKSNSHSPLEAGEPPPDGMLIEAVLSGRNDQFARLVERYQGPLTRLAESRLGRSDWAEDAVQETFLCAYKWLSSYDSRYSFRTWLWTILLNQCRRQYKRRARRGAEVGWDAPEAIAAGRSSPESLAARESDMPLARLLAKERRQRLRSLLERLPEPQADALRLRFFGQLKFQEIAETMGCSLSTAKNRVRWGLTRLSQFMEVAAGESASAKTDRDRATAGRSPQNQSPKSMRSGGLRSEL